MATTTWIPLHVGKDGSILKALQRTITYVENPNKAISQYAGIQELDAATLNRLVKAIIVHEKIDDDGERHITIEIHFNLQPMPEVQRLESAS